MTDWEASGWVKIERAKEHVRNLEAEITTFLEGHPYEIVRQIDEQAGHINYCLHVLRAPPLRFGAIAGDALHNLRSALDILWRYVWYPGGGGGGNRRNEFPIFDTAKGLEARYPQKRFIKSRDKAAVDLIHGIMPFKGGNDLLWMLHTADAVDKHRLLLPVYARLLTAAIDRYSIPFGPSMFEQPLFVRIDLRRTPLTVEDGATVFDTPLYNSTHMDMGPQPTFHVAIDIAFGGGGAIEGQPMIPMLNQFVGEVEGIVEAFRRAGLVG